MAKGIIRESTWNYEGFPLRINVSENGGCFIRILKAIKGQLDAMLSRRSRLMVLRVDLHVSSYSGANSKVSRMVDKLKRWLGERYSMDLVGHVWVRELESSSKQHYHLAVVLDARKVRHPSVVLEWIERYWQTRDEPKPFVPRKCFMLVNRGDMKSYEDAFYRLSYLAKIRGKGHKDATANNYSVSRIKPAT